MISASRLNRTIRLRYNGGAMNAESLLSSMMRTTPRCAQALTYAKESLARFGHSHMTSAHLILGLLMLRSGIPFNVLQGFGLSIESVEGYLSLLRLCTQESTLHDGVPVGESVRTAVARGEAEAQARQHTYLGTDHLFLGILAEENGEAADLFASVHIDRDKLRSIVSQELA